MTEAAVCTAEQPCVNVVATANRAYLPYLDIMVQSLFAHRNPARRYRVMVLSLDIADADLNPVRLYTSQIDANFDITLAPLAPHASRLDALCPSAGFSREVFFRLIIPDVLPDVDRIVYLDCDLVVLDDIARLFDEDLGPAAIGACIDPGMAGMVGGYDPAEGVRLRDELNLSDPYGYFCAGVLLWDLAKTRLLVPTNDLLSYVVEHRPRYNDQDTLNHFFQDHVRHLDMRWNALYDSEGVRVDAIVPHAPREIQEAYRAARANPAIFHYAGPVKPWSCDVDGSERFWREARRSAGYEQALASYMAAVVPQKTNEALADIKHDIDNLYFQSSEGERIRYDLHLRATALEQRAGELQAQIDELRALKTPVLVRLYRRLKRFLNRP